MERELSEVEQRFYAAITNVVNERAEAVRQERERTREIAALCIDARREGVLMADLAKWVKVLNPKTDELRSVSRQSVDQLVAAHEGRERAPRRRPSASNNGRRGGIKIEAFS